MRNIIRIVLFSMVGLLLTQTLTQAALVKVARRYNVVDAIGGYAHPLGSYDGLGIIDFTNGAGQRKDLSAAEVFDPTFSLGIRYGQLRNNHMLMNFGFRYSRINEADSFVVDDYVYRFVPDNPDVHQFDVEFNFNYLLTNIHEIFVAPYVGLGLRAGFTTFSGKGVESESRVNIGSAINFGAEVRVWSSAKQRDFVTVASVNSFDFWGSANRPRHFYVGGGLKYYFRM